MKCVKRLFVGLFVVMAASSAMAAVDGQEWLNSAPEFCSSEPYSNLTPKQMAKCHEAAFRYKKKNWKTITASNGQAYEIALDTIYRDLPTNTEPRATLRAATVVVYISEGDTFNIDNVVHFYFDCHDRFQTNSRSFWSPSEYAPPLSIAAKISSVACTHKILRTDKVTTSNVDMEKSEMRELKRIKSWFDEGVDVNETTLTTKLTSASAQGHKYAVKFLLERGADVNKKDKGDTALIWASRGGYKEVVQLLLDHGADVNVVGVSLGQTALIEALMNHHEDVVPLLLDHGADVNVRIANNGVPGISGATALSIASAQVVQLLLNKGADVNARADSGATALFVASNRGHKDVVQLLLDKGADTNVKDNTGATALFIATKKGHKDVVQLLHQHGAASADNDGFVTQGGLSWMPVYFSTKSWSEANAYCTNTAINGQTGWRLPTMDELTSLSDSGAMKDHGWTLNYTWSSTPYAGGSHYTVILGGDGRYPGAGSDQYNKNLVSCVH